MCRLVVSCDAPYRILAAGSKIKKLMGFTPHQLNGCILQSLEGPDTDTVSLHAGIKAVCNDCVSTPYQFVLYDSKGRSRYMMVSFSRYQNESGLLIGCMLTIENSCAVQLGEYAKITSKIRVPWALASMSMPHSISTVNCKFFNQFGWTATDLEGMSLLDLNSPTSEPEPWYALLRMASTGRVGTGEVCIRTQGGIDIFQTVTCIPVVEWPNSRVVYVAFAFGDTHVKK
mmetsp:Transcript_38455/g.80637  ORF Transcript_38455/g.80637 Transcript_38455/m.80637 type:complete len:229 (-) Transcript_38455:359-1045(-)